MTEKIVYEYDTNTKEYIGTLIAPESPLEPGVYYPSPNTSYIAPPTISEHQAVIYKDNSWQIVADYRNTTYYDTTNQEEHSIKELGISPEANWTTIKPTDKEQTWDGNAWVIPFSVMKQRKLNEVKASFNQYVSGSFNCSLNFPLQFNESDSLKMEGAIQLLEASKQTTGYITDANDVTHYDITVDKMKEIKLEMLSEFAKAHLKKQQYRAAIESATTQAELDAITFNWDSDSKL
jgi:hypothetical protein